MPSWIQWGVSCSYSHGENLISSGIIMPYTPINNPIECHLIIIRSIEFRSCNVKCNSDIISWIEISSCCRGGDCDSVVDRLLWCCVGRSCIWCSIASISKQPYQPHYQNHECCYGRKGHYRPEEWAVLFNPLKEYDKCACKKSIHD